jgi:hypothetical protein
MLQYQREPYQFKEKIKGKSRQISNTHSIQTENSREKQAEIEEKRTSPMTPAFWTLGARVLTSSLSHDHSSNLSWIRVCGYVCRRREEKV